MCQYEISLADMRDMPQYFLVFIHAEGHLLYPNLWTGWSRSSCPRSPRWCPTTPPSTSCSPHRAGPSQLAHSPAVWESIVSIPPSSWTIDESKVVSTAGEPSPSSFSFSVVTCCVGLSYLVTFSNIATCVGKVHLLFRLTAKIKRANRCRRTGEWRSVSCSMERAPRVGTSVASWPQVVTRRVEQETEAWAGTPSSNPWGR